MTERGIAKTPRERFMRTVNDEIAKWQQKELAFQRAERDERAARLPLDLSALTSNRNHERYALPLVECPRRCAVV